jgi:Ca2+-transporting ATPase
MAERYPLHAHTAEEVARVLGSDSVHGLSEAEAAMRLEREGPNRLWRRERPDYVWIAVRQVLDPLVALLIAAAAVSALIGEGVEAVAIAFIVALNTALGFVQELAAERAVLALRETVAERADVVRGGREQRLDAEAVVPGDLLVVREGDRIPADARVVSLRQLEADESALTGESLPVAKGTAPVAAETPLADRTSMLYAGTSVTRGRGTALVVATAARTELGQITALAAEAKPPPTPLQRRLAALARGMVAAGAAITVLLAAGMVGHGADLHEAFLVGVAVAVAAVPEGLAATMTIALALGARAMARAGAIVRRLAAIETLGETTVICTDKTGTLTENRLRLAHALPADGVDERRLLAAAVLSSSAELVETEDGYRIAGDPIEGALLLAAMERGLSRDDVFAGRTSVLEIPFGPERRRMTVVYEEDGRRHVVVKGAPEELLARAARRTATEEAMAGTAAAWAGDGLRVLAVGERWADPGDRPQEIDSELSLLGLVALHDPLRETAPGAIQAARRAGIKVLMLTGDHPETARTVGHALGLEDGAIFARITPAEKLALVTDLQAAGEVVAVTGDGINDAPALRRSDVGVAMGRSGTEAAREAAAVVLTDDDFSTIVAAVREGRRIADNVRKFIAFLLSANLGEVVLFAAAVMAGLGAPMTVVQVLTVNILTDGLPALALARDPETPETMRLGPRGGALLPPVLRTIVLAAGLLIGLLALAAFLAGRAFGDGSEQTMAYATIALAELAFVFTCRSVQEPAWRVPINPYLLAGVGASLVVLGLTIYAPALQDAFGTVPLADWEVALVAGLAVVPFVAVEGGKTAARRLAARRPAS